MDKTIAAISTAIGEGGIGIVRISGEKSLEILKKIFKTKSEVQNRRMTYGNIVNPKTLEVVDEVLAVYMKGPHTYTCEDVVEINCHGGVVPLQKTLALVLQNGARMAERGEFTKRAFLNGRLDLSQAEAVIDIIKARTDKTFEVAISQLEGKFSKQIKNLRNGLVDILVDITVNIDYPDEDIEEIIYSDLAKKIEEIKGKIDALISTKKTGRILRDGLKIAIVGKPNVGKSSLLNMLLNENRAIVTAIPGTTRDIIEESININGVPVILTDTAGIRQTNDAIEKIGIEKSKESFNNADIIIFMIDASNGIEAEDKEIASYIGERKAIILLNKIDVKNTEISDIERTLQELLPDKKNVTMIRSSMVEGLGINELTKTIEEFVYQGNIIRGESLIVSNARQMQLLDDGSNALSDALTMIRADEALEFIEVDVKKAYDKLGEIVGETVSDNIINEVFKRFCLGK